MLRWLERRLGWLAIPNVTTFLIGGQVLTFLVGALQPDVWGRLLLVPSAVATDGEYWRLATFPFLAPLLDVSRPGAVWTLLVFLIEIRLLWLFGYALEAYWGTLRYNLFLLTGYLATLAGAGLSLLIWGPAGAYFPFDVFFWFNAFSLFVHGAVFLAFCWVYPDFVIRAFFILPIRIKWLGLAAWVVVLAYLVLGNHAMRLTVLAGLANVAIFLGRDMISVARLKGRTARRRVAAAAERDEPFHRCVVCGRTEKTDPPLEFRYARTAEGVKCFCVEHLPTGNGAGLGEPAGGVER